MERFARLDRFLRLLRDLPFHHSDVVRDEQQSVTRKTGVDLCGRMFGESLQLPRRTQHAASCTVRDRPGPRIWSPAADHHFVFTEVPGFHAVVQLVPARGSGEFVHRVRLELQPLVLRLEETEQGFPVEPEMLHRTVDHLRDLRLRAEQLLRDREDRRVRRHHRVAVGSALRTEQGRLRCCTRRPVTAEPELPDLRAEVPRFRLPRLHAGTLHGSDRLGIDDLRGRSDRLRGAGLRGVELIARRVDCAVGAGALDQGEPLLLLQSVRDRVRRGLPAPSDSSFHWASHAAVSSSFRSSIGSS